MACVVGMEGGCGNLEEQKATEVAPRGGRTKHAIRF